MPLRKRIRRCRDSAECEGNVGIATSEINFIFWNIPRTTVVVGETEFMKCVNMQPIRDDEDENSRVGVRARSIVELRLWSRSSIVNTTSTASRESTPSTSCSRGAARAVARRFRGSSRSRHRLEPTRISHQYNNMLKRERWTNTARGEVARKGIAS